MELECEFLDRGWLNVTKYTCDVKSITSSQSNAHIKLARGTHLPGKTNDDVEFLWIKGQIVERIPKGISQLFPKLTILHLWKCGLKEISKSDLVGLEKLENLEISGNPLKSLPDDLFANMKNLRRIYCQSNHIETLSSKIFDPIKDNDLQLVNFRDNPKLDAYFKVNTEDTLEKLMATIDQTCTPPTPPRTQAVEWTQEMPEKMKQILISRKFSDFCIKVKGKEFHVHKFVLASQSSVFEKMFSDDAEQGAKILKDIKDFSAETFEDFIDYFYTGIIRKKSVEVQLFELASQFDVPQLKTMCEEAILKNLNEANAQEIYNLGNSSSIHLKQGAFAFLQKSIPELTADKLDDAELINEIIEARNQLKNLLQRKSNVL